MALDWLPVAIDPPRVRTRRPAIAISTQNYDPIPNPAPPTELTWQPRSLSGQANLARNLPLRLSPAVFLWLGAPQIGLSFLPRYLGREVQRRLPPHRLPWIAAAPPALRELPKLGGWRPQYPDRPKRPGPHRAGFVAAGQAFVFTDDLCLEIRQEQVIEPDLIASGCTVPMLLNEQVIEPTLSVEDLC